MQSPNLFSSDLAVYIGAGNLIVSPITITPAGGLIGAAAFPLTGIPADVTFDTSGNVTVDEPLIVPLQPTAAQLLSVTLNQQDCILKVYFKQVMIPGEASIPTEPPVYTQVTPCFMDIYLSGSLLLGGVLCRDRTVIVRNAYLGFLGDLAMVDTQGLNDPEIATLGSRYLLTYWPTLKLQ